MGTYFTSRIGSDRSSYIYTLLWNRNFSSGERFIQNSSTYSPIQSWDIGTYRFCGRPIRAVANPNAVTADGIVLNIITDSASWKLGDKTTRIYGTLSCTKPFKNEVTVGFVIGDSAKIDKTTARFDLSHSTSIGGSFFETLPVYDNIGYWYRAYVQTKDTVIYDAVARHYGYEMVDLGLSVKWANMNIGADQPSDYGNYYAWAETETKTTYNSSTYKYGSRNMGNALDIAGTENDAAHVNMGNAWRMPRPNEMQELMDSCSWAWTSQNGISGFKVTGKTGNSIFLPAAGVMNGSSLSYATYGCGLYSSQLGGNNSNYAYTLSWRSNYSSGARYLYNTETYQPLEGWGISTLRYLGRPVRAVADPNAVTSDGIVMNILTDSAVWKLDDTNAVIYGTISCTTPPSNGLKVGFVVGDNQNLKKENALYDYSQELTDAGVFSKSLTVQDNIGYWYCAYVETADSVIYGQPRHFGLEMVDLGLPSGTKWANMNVNADTPESFGAFYAWGETEEKGSYSSSNYTGANNLGSIQNIAGTERDAAFVNMGHDWVMPDRAQLQELIDNCIWTSTTQNNINGHIVKSRVNGNSIFFPAAGYKNNANHGYNNSGGSYYSASLGGKNSVYAATLSWANNFNNGTPYAYYEETYRPIEGWGNSTYRYYGRTVRAVSTPGTLSHDGRIVHVVTESATWLSGETSAVLHGTISSSSSLGENVSFGFQCSDHLNLALSSSTTYQAVTPDEEGHMSLEIPMTADGCYYRVYLYDGNNYYYGKTLYVGQREMVDLGLPSRTLWANVNLGSSVPEGVGDYYAWGETESRQNFTYGVYELKDNDGYIDLGENISGTQYDAARAQWGGVWRMPTVAEMDELRSNCNWSYVTVNGQRCYKASSKSNSNYILLPEGGAKGADGVVSNGSYWAFYWTATKYDATQAYRSNLYGQSGIGGYYQSRETGLLIRPVTSGK
jgi:hypothetical protein